MPRRYRPYSAMPSFDRMRMRKALSKTLLPLVLIGQAILFVSVSGVAGVVHVCRPDIDFDHGLALLWVIACVAPLAIAANHPLGDVAQRRLIAYRTARRGRDVALRDCLRPTDVHVHGYRRVRLAIWGITHDDLARLPTLWRRDAHGVPIEARHPSRVRPVLVTWREPLGYRLRTLPPGVRDAVRPAGWRPLIVAFAVGVVGCVAAIWWTVDDAAVRRVTLWTMLQIAFAIVAFVAGFTVVMMFPTVIYWWTCRRVTVGSWGIYRAMGGLRRDAVRSLRVDVHPSGVRTLHVVSARTTMTVGLESHVDDARLRAILAPASHDAVESGAPHLQ